MENKTTTETRQLGRFNSGRKVHVIAGGKWAACGSGSNSRRVVIRPVPSTTTIDCLICATLAAPAVS